MPQQKRKITLENISWASRLDFIFKKRNAEKYPVLTVNDWAVYFFGHRDGDEGPVNIDAVQQRLLYLVGSYVPVLHVEKAFVAFPVLADVIRQTPLGLLPVSRVRRFRPWWTLAEKYLSQPDDLQGALDQAVECVKELIDPVAIKRKKIDTKKTPVHIVELAAKKPEAPRKKVEAKKPKALRQKNSGEIKSVNRAEDIKPRSEVSIYRLFGFTKKSWNETFRKKGSRLSDGISDDSLFGYYNQRAYGQSMSEVASEFRKSLMGKLVDFSCDSKPDDEIDDGSLTPFV